MATSFPSRGVEMAQEATNTVIGTASSMVKALMQSTIVESYVRPMVIWMAKKYDSSPVFVKLSLWALMTTAALPLACFLGFMTAVTFGCLIVGGMTFGVIEGSIGVFASAFLLPTLGVASLVAFGVGATILVASLTLRAVNFVLRLIMGRNMPVEKRVRRSI